MSALDSLSLNGFQAPPHIDEQLQNAAQVYHETENAERILKAALATDRNCLASYFSMYKFYFYKRRLHDAENTARAALEIAAALGSFSPNWKQLTPTSTDWSKVSSPQHFYLFTLKALAFMRLRLGSIDDSRQILDKLHELDPKDSVGADVIRALFDGAQK